ncbi:MAG TPA: uroporphyrinogen-III C-methyltransferase [Sandaracinaceae bacterium LLY-WYZ-13_1]|nr:uroporphyrinogen-III C-methyltransferase [Sandaracinaceae bacterium LLY-WYZ-13_1]
MSAPTKGKVYLLGAGPGDPELITARALRRLGEADLVLYDALVHPDLLEHVRPSAETVFVGKRAGRPSARQQRINERMLEAARAGRIVARLKGGDPYLFGRGSEEAELLAEHGVPFEVVPGVPSPMAAMAYAGISLTHRTRSSSVAYLTATESVQKDASSHDWAKLATGPQTLVIFMGMRKLPTLMRRLIEHGRPADTPAAVVQWASLPKQRTVVGTVATIAERAREAGLGLPALTIVGDVVELRQTLRWYDTQPLFGRRVLVTRPAHQSQAISRMLRDHGAEPICVPAIRIEPPEDAGPLREAVADAGRYRWVVFTSRNGVRAFFEEVARQERDSRVLGGARICAIGPATAEELTVHGLRPDVIPEEFKGEGAAEAVMAADPDLAGHRVLLPRAAVARQALPEMLREAGAEVDVVPAYQTLGASEGDAIRLRELIHHRRVDVLTFTSPSTVREVAGALGEHADAIGEGFTIACIGPITAAAAEERGWPVHVVPEDYTAEGLLDALVTHHAEGA